MSTINKGCSYYYNCAVFLSFSVSMHGLSVFRTFLCL